MFALQQGKGSYNLLQQQGKNLLSWFRIPEIEKPPHGSWFAKSVVYFMAEPTKELLNVAHRGNLIYPSPAGRVFPLPGDQTTQFSSPS
jgi:hypothetical protein